MSFENYDIRSLIMKSGIRYKDIAEKIGITNVHLSRLMKKPLNIENRARILGAVYELKPNLKKSYNINNTDHCPFCKLITPGNIDSEYFLDDTAELHEKVNLGSENGVFSCDIDFEEEINICGVVEPGNGELWISLSIQDEKHEIFEHNERIKISYCPFCGRKIGGVVSV